MVVSFFFIKINLYLDIEMFVLTVISKVCKVNVFSYYFIDKNLCPVKSP